MPIAATCQCGRQYMMKDEFAGKRAKCPECGRMVQVPALPPSSVGSGPAPAAVEATGMSGRKMLLISGGVNLAALIGLIFFIIYLNMNEMPSPYRDLPRSSAKTPAPAPAPAKPAPGPVSPGAATPAAPVRVPAAPKPSGEPGPGPAVAVRPPSPPTVSVTPAPVGPAPSVTPDASVTPVPVAPTPVPAVETPAPVPTAPAPTPPAPRTRAAPAPAAGGGKVAVFKEDTNGGTIRIPVGQVVRIEIPAKPDVGSFVKARLIDEEGGLKDLGQDKEAEKDGILAYTYKGAEVTTATLTVLIADTDPDKKEPAKRWRYNLTIKVREDAPPGGRFSPPYSSRRPGRE